MKELDDKASALGRMLTFFQLSVGQGMPVPVIKFQVQLVHKISGELLEMLGRVPHTTVVHMDPSPGPNVTALLAELYEDEDGTPDTFPEEWNQ